MKWRFGAHLAHGIAQKNDIAGQELASAIVEIDREEIRSSLNPITSACRHRLKMPTINTAEY
jgi:hypothetical protein